MNVELIQSFITHNFFNYFCPDKKLPKKECIRTKRFFLLRKKSLQK
jgi:hypothetical protein